MMVTMMQGEGGAGSLRRDWGELAGNSKVEMIKIMTMVMIMIMLVINMIIMVMIMIMMVINIIIMLMIMIMMVMIIIMMDDSDDFDDDDCIMLIVLKGQDRNVQAQLLTQVRFIFSSSKVNRKLQKNKKILSIFFFVYFFFRKIDFCKSSETCFAEV